MIHNLCMNVWRANESKVLKATLDTRKEAKHSEKYSPGVYKENFLVGHILILSRMCFRFLNHNIENKLKAAITGTHHREIGLVVQSLCF